MGLHLATLCELMKAGAKGLLIILSLSEFFAGGDSLELFMSAWLLRQDCENGVMEAACPQAVSAGLANPDGVGAPRLHLRYFLGSRQCQHGWLNRRMKIGFVR